MRRLTKLVFVLIAAVLTIGTASGIALAQVPGPTPTLAPIPMPTAAPYSPVFEPLSTPTPSPAARATPTPTVVSTFAPTSTPSASPVMIGVPATGGSPEPGAQSNWIALASVGSLIAAIGLIALNLKRRSG